MRAEIAAKGFLQHVVLAVDSHAGFAVCQIRADPGRCQETAEAGTGCAHAFGQSALWDDFKFDLPGVVQFFENKGFLGPGEAADQLRDAPFFDQPRNAAMAGAGIVGDDGQVTAAKVANPIDQDFGNTRLSEPTNEQGCTVVDPADGLFERF